MVCAYLIRAPLHRARRVIILVSISAPDWAATAEVKPTTSVCVRVTHISKRLFNVLTPFCVHVIHVHLCIPVVCARMCIDIKDMSVSHPES